MVKRFHHNMLQAGVTVIEMVVVVGIIALVSGVMIFNYSDFSTNVSVRNLSQEIALSVRKAQTYATSVRPIDGLSGINSKTFPGYGISFGVSDTAAPVDAVTPGPRQFILFADANTSTTDLSGMNAYEKGTSCGNPGFLDECLETFTISTADKVQSICVNEGTTRSACYTDDARLDITFRRPSPDAVICISTSSIDNDCSIAYAVVVLESAKGLQRKVLVWNTGQISVQ
jgi:Tfp pilus assembly protein FimT